VSSFSGITAITITLVASVSFLLALALWVASTKVGNPKIRWVSAGFFVLSGKSILIAIVVYMDYWPHEIVELVDAVFDLVVVLLVAAPFIMRD
jgi:hypothetical protein